MNYPLLAQRAVTALALITLISFCYYSPLLLSCLIAAVLIIVLLFEWPQFIQIGYPTLLLTPIYPVAPFIIAILMNHSPYRPLIILALTSTILCDTSAYLVGSYWGTYPIAPSVSPAKSWQGTLAGLFTTMLFWYALSFFIQHNTNKFYMIGYGSLAGLCAIAGDLCESWLKRCAQIKDSGRLLPGHGGLLDRCDSLLFVIPVFYFFRQHLASLFCFF